MHAAVRLAIVTLAAVAAVEPAPAQTSRGGAGGANSQIMQQYQQLSAERTTLLAESARLKQELQDAKAELATARKERDALRGRSGAGAKELEKANADRAAAEQGAAELRKRLDALLAKYKETIGVLEGVEGEKASLGRDLGAANRSLDQCAANNVALFDLNNEILKRWEQEGFWSRLSKVEPLTRLKRIELENAIDEYRARTDAVKLRTPPAAATPLAPKP
ncbi:MAG: hypothetical protein JSR73_11545 [Proteobacteria bacterium]|nr:hypothetical protein [Pseudomonadota bacterium]